MVFASPVQGLIRRTWAYFMATLQSLRHKLVLKRHYLIHVVNFTEFSKSLMPLCKPSDLIVVSFANDNHEHVYI